MRPQTEAELAEIIAARTTPLWIRGGGTAGIVPEGADVLDTGGMSGIALYEPGAMTMVAGAGTPVAEIEAALAAEGQRLAFEPWDSRAVLGQGGAPSIGGIAAMNASGPRRIQGGACRDFMLGVRFVDGTGTVLKNGGRVMKNVTGYDLVKLMAGSHGVLGVMSEVAFKVLPRPETQAALSIAGLDDAAAVRALSAALGSPFEATGAAHVPVGPAGTPVTLVRIEGFETQVRYRAGALSKLLAPFGSVSVEEDPAAVEAIWQGLRDLRGFDGMAGDLWRISAKPSDAPALVAALKAERVQYDWGGGLIVALMPAGSDVRARMGAIAGHATLIRGTGQPRFHAEPAALAQISAQLRARFDPKGIFNPALMGA